MYFAFNVNDDIHSQNSKGADCFRGDHVEVVLDLQPRVDRNNDKFGPGQLHVAFSPGSLDGKIRPEAFMYHPVRRNLTVPVQATRSKGGYQLEAMLPWAELGLKGMPAHEAEKLIAMDIMLSDTDSQKPLQEKCLYAGDVPFDLKRNRMCLAYFSDSRGSMPDNLSATGEQELAKELRLGKERKSVQVKFNYTPVENVAPVVKLTAYNVTYSADYNGYAPYLTLEVNGKRIEPNMICGHPNRVAKKDGRFYTFIDQAGRIYLPYLRNLGCKPVPGKINYFLRGREDLCEISIDIDKLIVPGENTISFVTVPHDPNAPDKVNEIHISSAVIGMMSKRALHKKEAPKGKLPVIEPKHTLKTNYDCTLNEDKSLDIRINGENYRISSRFTTPDGKYVTKDNSFFKLNRKVLRKDETIIIQDTFENISGKELPCMQFYEVTAAPSCQVMLNGLLVSKELRDYTSSNNASTYVYLEKSGVGLFPLSDVLRVHVQNFVSSNTTAGLVDRNLVIMPGQKYTLEIAVIPTERPDYYDFINALRREMKLNFQIRGSIASFNDWWYLVNVMQLTDEQKKTERIKTIITYLDADFATRRGGYSGANIYLPSSGKGTLAEMKQAAEEQSHQADRDIRKADKNVKIGSYYHFFLDYDPASAEKYKDCRVLNKYGEHELYGISKNKNRLYGIYIPTLENSFGKACEAVIDNMITNWRTGNDFFYCDEFSRCKVSYSYNDKYWDNCSADIDSKTFKIERKKTSLTLYSAPFRLAMIRKVKAAGMDVMINSQPKCRELMALQMNSASESATIENCLRTQVYTPIQFGNHLLGFKLAYQETAYHQMLEGLDYGVLYYYYGLQYIPDHHTLTQFMFPITPMELHQGYIIGTDRVITKVSGLYGWGDDSQLEVHIYDDKGWPSKALKAPVVSIKGKNYVELRLPEDWSAAILRKSN